MPPIRQSNRAHKPKVYWEPPPPTHRRRQPAFTIHANLSEDQPIPEDLGTQSPEDLGTQSSKDLDTQFPEDLDSQPEDLDSQPEEDLDMQFSDDLDSQPEDLDSQPKDLDSQPEDLDLQLKDLDSQPKDLDMKSAEDQSYQSQFLSKNRADKSQNLSEDSNSLKLFQLFFTVKEMKNIVKQTNQQTAYTSFDTPWMPLTVTEAYHYLGCLVYMGIQPLRELHDYWHLKTPIACCLSWDRFIQIRRAFTIQDPCTSPQQPGDP